ncbi:MAG: PaaX family transcriptional regulator C-terminal domain-containing protein [Actinomycetota bacterium]
MSRSTPGPVASHLQGWLGRPDISARSVLVTILGDAVRPVCQSLWSAQLFALSEPFGFSERLVRTSLFRLAADGWVENERVGRQSRYSMTAHALRESADVDDRIYGGVEPDWDGHWTFVMLDRAQLAAKEVDRLIEHLGWQGFIALDRSVLVSPTVPAARARELLAMAEPAGGESRAVAAVARGEIDDLDGLVQSGAFADAFRHPATAAAYEEFVAAYRPLAAIDAADLAPVDAFALRTTLVHDLRRIVLRHPPLPAALLPPDWAGVDAQEVAAELYHPWCARSASWLSDVLGEAYPERFGHRFTAVPSVPLG